MKLTNLKLYQENKKYYLSAKFFFEDKRGFYEMSIPKIDLHISPDCEINVSSKYDDFNVPHNTVNVDLGFGLLRAKPFNNEGSIFTVTCLEEKVHKMTLAEIEEELGYKIELKEKTK